MCNAFCNSNYNTGSLHSQSSNGVLYHMSTAAHDSDGWERRAEMGYSQTCTTAHELETATICRRAEHSYYAEVDKQHLDEQGDLIDQIIDHAFDTLDAR